MGCTVFNFSEILSVTMVLFAVIDIIGSIPVIISLRNRVGHIQSEKATLAATVIMILFLFVGEGILKLFGVDVASFAVAGSLVLFFLRLIQHPAIFYQVHRLWQPTSNLYPIQAQPRHESNIR